MKFYLAANFKTSYKHLLEDMGGGRNKKLGLILNAADMYTKREWIQETVDLVEQNFSEVIQIDLREETNETLLSKLKNIEVLLVNGGNVFHLMHVIKQKGLYETFESFFLETEKIYIGSSAGSCLLGKDMGGVNFLESHKFDYSKLGHDLSGFGLVDYCIIPHWGREKYVDRFPDILQNFDYKKAPLLLLRDEQTLVINEGGDLYYESN